MGSSLTQGIPTVEGCPVRCTDASLPRSQTTIFGGNGCFADSRGVCVLMQDQGDGPHPIAFMSRVLRPTEQWYSAYERELATIAYCFIQWRFYLEGCPGGVTVVTDHQPLTHLMDHEVLSWLQSRWLRLGLFQSIQPKMVYQPGKANIVADALSWSQSNAAKSEEAAQ